MSALNAIFEGLGGTLGQQQQQALGQGGQFMANTAWTTTTNATDAYLAMPAQSSQPQQEAPPDDALAWLDKRVDEMCVTL